jgi:hypothetical protein
VFRGTGLDDTRDVEFSKRFGEADDINPYLISDWKAQWGYYELFDTGNLDNDGTFMLSIATAHLTTKYFSPSISSSILTSNSGQRTLARRLQLQPPPSMLLPSPRPPHSTPRHRRRDRLRRHTHRIRRAVFRPKARPPLKRLSSSPLPLPLS